MQEHGTLLSGSAEIHHTHETLQGGSALEHTTQHRLDWIDFCEEEYRYRHHRVDISVVMSLDLSVIVAPTAGQGAATVHDTVAALVAGARVCVCVCGVSACVRAREAVLGAAVAGSAWWCSCGWQRVQGQLWLAARGGAAVAGSACGGSCG